MKTPLLPSPPVYIHGCALHCALGDDPHQIKHALQSGVSFGMNGALFLLNDKSQVIVGRAQEGLPCIPSRFTHQNTRNNQLAYSVLKQITQEIQQAKNKYGSDKIAVIVGSSTSGISDGEKALIHHVEQGELPEDYDYYQQELINLADFVQDYFGLTGLAYTTSTACSSSGRAFISAQRLLKSGMAKAVLVGGVDTLCQLTLNGFHALDSLSSTPCIPFQKGRKGINIGEGAAFMLLSLEKPNTKSPIALLGVGESSDAYHISAPDPEGCGAEKAMRNALDDAHLSPSDVGYINAHGTATPLNDAMESKAIYRVFAQSAPVSSTKSLTGHTLGAASAIEACICWHILNADLNLPAPLLQKSIDPELDPIRLVQANEKLTKRVILSNSFAFGGNNVSLIFGTDNPCSP